MRPPIKPGMTVRQAEDDKMASRECREGKLKMTRWQAEDDGKALFQIHKVQYLIPDVLFADFIEDFMAHARI